MIINHKEVFSVKKKSKQNQKLEEVFDKIIVSSTYQILPHFYEFLKKYEKELKDVQNGKMTIVDFEKRVKYDNVHDYLGKIILLIKENPKITLEELAITIGISKKTVQRVIGASDKIVRIGSARNGHWEIKD